MGKSDFAAKLATFQEQRGMSRLQLARAMGVSKITVWRWESGLAVPTERSLAKFEVLRTLPRQELMLRCQPYRKGKIRAERKTPEDSFGNRLHRIRNEKRMSVVEVSRALGVTRQVLWKWETNASHPANTYVYALAEVLQVPVAELVAGSGIVGSPSDDLPRSQRQKVDALIARSKLSIATAAGTTPDNVTIIVTR